MVSDNMNGLQTHRSKIPLPTVDEKRLVQAEVDMGLFLAVEKNLPQRGGKRKLKIRQVVEWGLKVWLLESNPKEARRLNLVGAVALPQPASDDE